MSRALIISLTFLALLEGGFCAASEGLLEEGRRLLDEGRLAESVRTLDSFLERHPSHTEALKIRALGESGLGRYDAAERDYEKILEKEPENEAAHRELGLLLAFKKKDAKAALRHLDASLSLFEAKGAADEMKKTAELMRSLDASHSALEKKAVRELLAMARAFAAEGKERVAMRTYERVLEIQPTCAECHESLGQLMARHHREEAEQHLTRARLFRLNG